MNILAVSEDELQEAPARSKKNQHKKKKNKSNKNVKW